MLNRIFFPLALIASALAVWRPELFVWGRPHIGWLLGVIMFGMGITLKPGDFVGVWRHKRMVAIGAAAQFTVMPVLAWLISLALRLPDEAMVGMATIVFIIAIVAGLTRDKILAFPVLIFLAVILHNGFGLALGYGAAALANAGVAERRTLAIEVGMQNSGLAVALAGQFFTGLAALPGALFSLWHNLTGLSLAAWWTRDTTSTAYPRGR